MKESACEVRCWLRNPANCPRERSARLLLAFSSSAVNRSNNAWCEAPEVAVNQVVVGCKDAHAMQVSAQVAMHSLQMLDHTIIQLPDVTSVAMTRIISR
jgi:hypothetical protein